VDYTGGGAELPWLLQLQIRVMCSRYGALGFNVNDGIRNQLPFLWSMVLYNPIFN